MEIYHRPRRCVDSRSRAAALLSKATFALALASAGGCKGSSLLPSRPSVASSLLLLYYYDYVVVLVEDVSYAGASSTTSTAA